LHENVDEYYEQSEENNAINKKSLKLQKRKLNALVQNVREINRQERSLCLNRAKVSAESAEKKNVGCSRHEAIKKMHKKESRTTSNARKCSYV